LSDQAAAEFQGLCRDLVISNDDYIRTTEDRHKNVVRTLLQKLFDEGQIYKADYQGYYSPRQEQFLQEKDKVGGKWPAIFGDVIELTESNYFFKLKQYQDWLIDHLKQHPEFVVPAFRLKDVLSFLKEPLNDLCISRPRDRLEWGIPLPFDEDYVTYVWFDALLNYVSGAAYGTPEFEKRWPADFHVIGKDILVPPHAIYWPIMLHACGIELPKSLLVHGWWLTSGQKMSKSSGEVVNPLDLVGQFGADAFRYFVMREMSVGQDSDFSVELFLSRYSSDLANDLGNLVNRTLNMTNRYREATLPAAGDDESYESELKALWESTREEAVRLNSELQFHLGLDRAFTFIRAINRYAEQRAPWKLGKSQEPADQQALSTTLATMAESLRLAVTLIEPVMPETANKVRAVLGAQAGGAWQEQLQWGNRLDGAKVGETSILFPRPEKA
jgi:methionyl-tRNA synthetase